jgi:hypothetical protein
MSEGLRVSTNGVVYEQNGSSIVYGEILIIINVLSQSV